METERNKRDRKRTQGMDERGEGLTYAHTHTHTQNSPSGVPTAPIAVGLLLILGYSSFSIHILSHAIRSAGGT